MRRFISLILAMCLITFSFVDSRVPLSGAEEEAGAVDVVRTVANERLTGRILFITEDGRVGLKLGDGETVTELDLASIHGIRLNTQRKLPERYFKYGAIFHLSDGTRITGKVEKWGEDFVTIRNEYCRAVIDRRGIISIAFGEKDVTAPHNTGESDIIVLNDKPDVKLECKIISLEGWHVTYKVDGSEHRLACIDVRSIAPAGSDEPVGKSEKGGWYACVRLDNRDRVPGTITGMDENTLTLLTRYAGVVSLKRKLLDRVIFLDSLSFSSGRYLVTDYNGNRVILFNNEGKRIWEYTGCRGPWDAVWLPDGKILVSSCDDGSLTVLSEDGKLIRQFRPGLRSPRGLVVLDNGDYLVAEYAGACLTEVTPDGKIKERYFSGDVQGPMALRMTQNGNFIVAERRARRVTIRSLKTRQTIWSKDGLNNVYGAQQLGNGYVAAVFYGLSPAVRVYDAKGKERWSMNTRGVVYDVGVTAAGDAIIPVLKTVGGKNIIVLTECSCDDGKVLREVPLEGMVSRMASLVQD
ncbi:MAG: hypothetical protein DRP79_02585 [Planctomycetota bacterium]|nr:MAG: hypothetical protein DRP79_02585 [Planctomycetota bacterium]